VEKGRSREKAIDKNDLTAPVFRRSRRNKGEMKKREDEKEEYKRVLKKTIRNTRQKRMTPATSEKRR
jgi:hypothetical protein